MPPKKTTQSGERLQKVLAAAGIASRRSCEELILAGRVAIDGKVVVDLGVRVDPNNQRIKLDGEYIYLQRKRYFLLNKPKGYLCTNSDPAGRQRVIDLFPKEKTRLFTVGRLDENTHGLLLVTNDGELANRLAHPRYRIARTYLAQVVGNPSRETLDLLCKGIRFSEGYFRAESVRRRKSKGLSTYIEIVMNKGRNREIRRLLARVGHKIIDLQRIAFGPLKLGHLKVGRHRALKEDEIESLRQFKSDLPTKKQSRVRSGSTGRSTTSESRSRSVKQTKTGRPSTARSKSTQSRSTRKTRKR
jgi:23S rRNA pseudouridine2605 synthase